MIFAALRRYRLDLAVLAGIVVLGLFRILATEHFGFDIGDNSTFLEFGRNIASGQAIYKDFIHFRMPGYYFVNGLFLHFLTPNFATLHLATGIDFIIGFTAAFYISAKILTKSTAIAAVSALLILFFPEILQLRSGFGLLAVALYAKAIREPEKERWLIFSGLSLGLDFLYGQEIAIMAAAAIFASEVYFQLSDIKLLARRLGLLLLGSLIVVIPLVVYISLFSDFSNFIYYAFYYALVVQPSHMNLPYPPLSAADWIYYLPLFVYPLCFAAFSLSGRFRRIEALALSFGVLRMISAMGRADISHLMFSIPEMFFIAPWALVSLAQTKQLRINLRLVAGVIVLGGVILLALAKGSVVLLLAAAVLPLFAQKQEKTGEKIRPIPAFLVTAACTALFAVAFWPQLWGLSLHTLLDNLHTAPRNLLSGVEADPATYKEVTSTAQIIRRRDPAKLFSYPIQPFFYTLLPARAHASRFITFEHETTLKEQQEAVADLERSRPGLVIMDADQAGELSNVLYLVNNYVTSNYRPIAQVNGINHLVILEPKPTRSFEVDLMLNLGRFNPSGDTTAFHLEAAKDEFTDAVLQTGGSARFEVTPPGGASFITSVQPVPGSNAAKHICGVATVSVGGSTISRQICSSDGRISVDLSAFAGKTVTIRLRPATSDAVLWVNPLVESAVGA